MAMRNLERVAAGMMRAGLAPQTPAAVISAATTAHERVLVSTIAHLAADARAQHFAPPAIVVVGDIVAARDRLLGTADKASP
jgi:uroporphyrin-III C-methyltransferase